VLAAVVGQRGERFSREQGSAKTDTGHPAADSFRVQDGDPVESEASLTLDPLELLALPTWGEVNSQDA